MQPAQLGLRRPGALEHLEPQTAPARAAQQQPQRRGRWLLLRALRAAHEGQRLVAGLAGQLQPAQLFAACLGQPGQHGGHLGATQQLFGGPEGIGVAVRAHQQQLAGVQPLCLQCTQAGIEWGLHQRDGPGCAVQCFQSLQCWQQQPPFQAGQGAEQFGQLAVGPAATGEFGIKPGVPTGLRVLQGGGHGIGAPQAAVLLEQGIKANGVHAKYCT